jgi:hypothetical protein
VNLSPVERLPFQPASQGNRDGQPQGNPQTEPEENVSQRCCGQFKIQSSKFPDP